MKKAARIIATMAVTMGFGLPTVSAQPLRVYSEFATVDAKGQVTVPSEPREILSPALARNAYASFQIVVDGSANGGPADAPWELYIAQNPENAVRAELYRENGSRLERVEQPVSGKGVQVFWMDLWTDRAAPVRRIKVEPQLHLNNDWVIYPMEGRVVGAIVPDAGPGGRWPEGTSGPIDVMRGLVCAAPVAPSNTKAGDAKAAAPAGATIPGLRFRNAQQDRALAATAPKAELQQRFGACGAVVPANDPEWYYRVRDYLFRLP